MKINEIKHELVALGGGAHALAAHILGHPDDAFDIEEHVVEQLSGYVDGELTQQQRQRIDLHCASCAQCTSDLRELQKLRESVGNARLSNKNQDVWREMMNDTTVQRTRGIGWLLLTGGVLPASALGFSWSCSIHRSVWSKN